ncbi:MAG: hypothetical protein HY352_04420 [Candidatus Omnitrophica bacterium]|nr:hypothetical protein [Candidatus Omnitrophota bacterium]
MLRQDLSELLRPVRRVRGRASLVVVAPNSHVRQLTMQVTHPSTIGSSLHAQLPALLPFDASEAHVQFHLERRQPINGHHEVVVSLMACERTLLQRDLEWLWRSGWMPTAVIPSALALVQVGRALGTIGAEPVVLMDIADRRTTIALVDAGAVTYARDVALGMEHLIDALTSQVSMGDRTLALSRPKAEALLRDVGIPHEASTVVGPVQIPVATYLAMIQPVLEQLASEIRRTMTSGAHATTATPPTRLLISGEACRLARYDTWLAAQLGMSVTRLTCESLLGESGATAAVVCGAALCDQMPSRSLLLPMFHRRRIVTTIAGYLWKTLLAMTLLIWLGTGWRMHQDQRLLQRRRELEAPWVVLQPAVSLQQQCETYAGVAQHVTKAFSLPPAWFHQLAKAFPNPVRLTRLDVSATRAVMLEGEAQERAQTAEATVSELTVWLQESRLCRDVQVGSTRRVEADGNLVAFSLTCQLTTP